MADSKAQRIIAEIVTRMLLINGTGDYLTDIGGRAEAGRQNWNGDGDASELPAISVFQGTSNSTDAPRSRRQTLHTMQVMIRAVLKNDDSADVAISDVNKIIADIKRAIRRNGTAQNNYIDECFPVDVDGRQERLATDTKEVSSGPEYAAEGNYEITGAQVVIQVEYLTEKFNAEE